MRLLGEATDLAQQARLQTARLLAGKGIARAPAYPDISTRQKAWDVAQTFVGGAGTKLLP
jgi:formate-dependent nitrite reductase cytochrome c552 subunit